MAEATVSTTGGTRQTRSATGHSTPRIFHKVQEVVAPSGGAKRGRKPGSGAMAKANTSKPRAKKTAGGRVSKTGTASATTTTKKKRGPAAKVAEKVNGVVEKVEGVIEGKPGKKGAGTKKLKGETTAPKKRGPKAKATVKA